MRIAVVALGKIGLPLAVQFADMGHDVIGVDISERTVRLVNEGTEPFPGEAHLAEKLAALVPGGKLRATSDYAEAIPGADAIVIVVPLFVNDATWEPDFAAMEAATRAFAAHMTPGTLVSYETTLPVGTTRTKWLPLIEQISGLQESKDFHLVFSPERVLTGRVFEDLKRYPKLVGGITPAGTRAGIEFYNQVLTFVDRPDLPNPNGVWDMGTAEAAEMAKLAETTYRDVNIGLANQFAVYADKVGIDIQRVIDACNSQPYSHIHRPGIAVGGHCIPVYPRLYLSTDADASVVRTARTVNAGMPAYVVNRVAEAMGSLEGRRIVVFGASYRGKVKETAFSGVFATVDELKRRGAEVLVHDPMYTDEELAGYGWTPFHLGEPAEAAVLQSDHPEYAALTPADVPGIKLLFDGRRVTNPANWAGTPRMVIGA